MRRRKLEESSSGATMQDMYWGPPCSCWSQDSPWHQQLHQVQDCRVGGQDRVREGGYPGDPHTHWPQPGTCDPHPPGSHLARRQVPGQPPVRWRPLYPYVHLTRPSYGQHALAFLMAILVTVFIVGAIFSVYKQWQSVTEQGSLEPWLLVQSISQPTNIAARNWMFPMLPAGRRLCLASTGEGCWRFLVWAWLACTGGHYRPKWRTFNI